MFSGIIFINIERIETANSIQQKRIKKRGNIVPLLNSNDFNTYSITHLIPIAKAPTSLPKYSPRSIKSLQSNGKAKGTLFIL